MIVTVTGIGMWGPGLTGWQDLCAAVADDANHTAEFAPPQPDAIPARERRRAGLTINLAVEVMHQACDMASVAGDAVATVFASAMGDTDITDYICRKLATESKLLSPTRFHNSVHNAPSGYWSISAVNRQPSSFVSAFRDSFAGGLLESVALAVGEGVPVGLAAYDVANQAPFGDVLAIDDTLGLALLMQPGEHAGGWRLTLAVESGHAERALPKGTLLARLATANPVGTGLALLEALARNEPAELAWPLGSGSRLRAVVAAREVSR